MESTSSTAVTEGGIGIFHLRPNCASLCTALTESEFIELPKIYQTWNGMSSIGLSPAFIYNM